MRRFAVHSLSSLALPALLIGGGATAQDNAPPYRAIGTEPFWALSMDARVIRLEEPRQHAIEVARPVPRPSFNGQRYVTRGMTVEVTHARCSDGMSDRIYRDTVIIRVGRRTLKGCGEPIQEASDGLANTRWTVWRINGRPIRTRVPLAVNFTADRIEGKLCNGFGGHYRKTGDRLRIENVGATRMACRGPAQLAETTLFAMWREPVRATVAREGELTLTGGGDTVTLRAAR